MSYPRSPDAPVPPPSLPLTTRARSCPFASPPSPLLLQLPFSSSPSAPPGLCCGFRANVRLRWPLEPTPLPRHAPQVRKLQGPPAAAASGWLAAAEERLLLEQILAVAKAESAIAMAALS